MLSTDPWPLPRRQRASVAFEPVTGNTQHATRNPTIDLFAHILSWLDARSLPYRLVEHSPVSSAEEAAAVRGTPLTMGAKCIVSKMDGRFALFVMRASDAMRSKYLRRELGVSRTRFASREELRDLTGCEPGAVPPFGRPVLDLDLYVDEKILENDEMVFTPGRRDRSVLMDVADWRRAVDPSGIFRFADPEGAA